MILLRKTKSYQKNTQMFGIELKTESNNKYRKDYMKIKFDSDDNLPLNKPLKFHEMTIIIRLVFKKGGKLFRNCF